MLTIYWHKINAFVVCLSFSTSISKYTKFSFILIMLFHIFSIIINFVKSWISSLAVIKIMGICNISNYGSSCPQKLPINKYARNLGANGNNILLKYVLDKKRATRNILAYYLHKCMLYTLRQPYPTNEQIFIEGITQWLQSNRVQDSIWNLPFMLLLLLLQRFPFLSRLI